MRTSAEVATVVITTEQKVLIVELSDDIIHPSEEPTL